MPEILTRRTALGAAGSALGMAFVGATALPADAASRGPIRDGDDVSPGRVAQRAAAGIASAPEAGVSYRTAMMYDFLPFSGASRRTWGGDGVYTADTAGALRATFEVPPAASLHDVEFYVYNSSGSAVSGDLLRWTPGFGSLTQIASVNIPSSGHVVAARAVVNAANAGPFGVGTVVLASVTTPTDGTVQVNGARLGLRNAPAGVVINQAPARAYISTKPRKRIPAGSTRTHSLVRFVPEDAAGVLVRLTAFKTVGAGSLIVGPGTGSMPRNATLSWTEKRQSLTTVEPVVIPGNRSIRVACTGPHGTKTRYAIDVVGYLM